MFSTSQNNTANGETAMDMAYTVQIKENTLSDCSTTFDVTLDQGETRFTFSAVTEQDAEKFLDDLVSLIDAHTNEIIHT